MLFETLLFAGIIGLVVGSFLNVVILRSMEGKSFSGRSVCMHCGHELGVLDLIPLVSFIWLRGKCRYCDQTISRQYFLVESLTAVLFAAVVYLWLQAYSYNFGLLSVLNLISILFVTSVLIVVFVTDWRWGIIPNKIIIPANLILLGLKLLQIVFALGLMYWSLARDSGGVGKYLLPPYSGYIFTLLGRIAIPVLFDILAALVVGFLFYLLVVLTRGRAMGGGDIKLGFFIGLAIGWPLTIVTLLLSFCLGAVVSLGLMGLGRKKFGQTIAFGPFLVSSAFITMFWGQRIFDWYLSLLKLP